MVIIILKLFVNIDDNSLKNKNKIFVKKRLQMLLYLLITKAFTTIIAFFVQ